MKKYQYVIVQNINPTIRSSDPAILDWIYEETKKHISTCAVRNEEYDLTGVRVGFQLHRLQDRDTKTYRWIIRLLCDSGFEPFAFDYEGGGASRDVSGYYHHFRRLVDG